MGTSPKLKHNNQPPSLRDERLRFGRINGAMLGLALGLGLWIPPILRLVSVPLPFFALELALGFGALILIGLCAGHVSAWVDRALASMVIWAGAGLIMTWVVGHLLFEGQTWLIWLLDSRFWGQVIYPSTEATQIRMGIAGFFFVLLLAIYGLLQSLRLDGLQTQLDERRRLMGQGWVQLTLALIPALAVGMIVDDILFKPVFIAPKVVHEAIQVARVNDVDDLFDLSLESAINYNVLRGVHDQLGGPYTLQIGEMRLGLSSEFSIVANFDSGAWINCTLLAGNLNNCYDMSAPYQRGFPSLIATGTVPVDCMACNIRVTPTQAADLDQRRARLGPDPVVDVLAQRGSHVLMRAASASGDYAFDCFLVGISPVSLGMCRDAQ